MLTATQTNKKNSNSATRPSSGGVGKSKRRASLLLDKALAETSKSTFLHAPPISQNTNPLMLSEGDLRKSFEEWMKIAADNKINATNSWNLALIDYFHDLTLLREGDTINFQKASCTLDGCVKIYTSRVDSVDAETKKLLSGLSESVNSDKAAENYAEEMEEENHDRRVRKKTRNCVTLEKAIEDLNLKKLDIDLMVDPLFKKTSADFDEGGSRGLLLNNLHLSADGRIIFDASDAQSFKSNLESDLNVASPKLEVFEELKKKFQPICDNISFRDVCPTLKAFKFSNQADEPLFLIRDYMRLSDDSNISEEYHAASLITFEDNFSLDLDQASYDGHDSVDLFPMADDSVDDPAEAGGMDSSLVSRGTLASVASKSIKDNMFAYFDTSLASNWAGAAHWRSRPIFHSSDGDKIAPKKSAKVIEDIDFSSELDVDQLFQSPVNHQSLLLKPIKADNLLPEDVGYSSKDMLRLFLKPYTLVLSGAGASGPLHIFGIAQAGQDVEMHPTAEVSDAENGDIGNDYFAPMDEPQFHDHPLHSDGPDGPNGLSSEEEHLDFAETDHSTLNANKPAPLKYAKIAKRVDVKRLKDDIWNYMSEDMHLDENISPVSFVAVRDAVAVSMVEKPEDVTVPFYFICLLHLANEKSLSVLSNERLDDLSIFMNCP